jgi:zinc transporter ZupT
MTLILIACATAVSTMLGGVFALRFSDKLHLILGFSAGAVIGVAFFDLLPEALELSNGAFEPGHITSLVAFAFLVYLFLDRFVVLHSHADDEIEHQQRGILGAGSLSIHSFLDGIGIGFAFQVSPAVGLIVAIAVLTHDFSDGLNTVNMILKTGGTKLNAFRWLIIDAVAPIAGIIVTLFFTVSQSSLSVILATFTGFFLYIGASDLLPESHHRHPTIWTSVLTALGIGVMYVAISLAHF